MYRGCTAKTTATIFLFCFKEIATCDADIAFFAERHDPDTRQWLLDDFSKWFNDPGDSRAYVLLGDAGVGKSVMAAVLAQRMRKAGNLGAAYFCRLNDGTRNNPRYLLGTIACQLCKCNSQYNNVVGGEGGIRKMLGNSELGVQELFTKLLLEPLAKCNPCQQRKLVVIDALDETKYESRDDFLDLIMNRFPQLPHWLVFFITSRPEDTVQFRLKKYNPCIKICTGSSENLYFYHQHEKDIKRFLENSIDFSNLPYSVEDIVKKCNGLFLYAFYIARFFKDPAHSGKIAQLTDLFPGDFEEFCLQNFKRVFDKVGADLYKTLFGCAIVAPSPLPVSFISFILQRENSDLEEQEVIDALSIFLVLQTSDQTFTFLHNLIPVWLTDKKKASRKLFVDRTKAGEYFRDIIAESLFAFVDKQAIGRPSIDADILEYIMRVGVRFLCGFANKDSLETICGCLTNLKFIQRRIQNRKREIYALIEDFKLAAECHYDVGVSAKKKVLQKICAALESNVYVLSECPHLLHSCLRSTSKDVQSAVNPDGVITTWMECTYFPYPGYRFPHDIKHFALSPDKKILAGGRQQFLFLFDACTLENVQVPIKLIEGEGEIHHLEFLPDGKFVFFGRLDKWFSVDQGCVKEFPQFAKNCRLFEWGSLFLDGRYIVVKDCLLQREKHDHGRVCVVNMFCRWAAQELDQMQDSDIVSWCDPDKLDGGLLVSRGFNLKSLKDLCEVLKRKQDVRWCSRLEENIRYYQSRAKHSYELSCRQCCEFEQRYQKTTLALVRQRVIELYHVIFKYQMWNMESGRPALEEAFAPGVPLSPFSFLCHLITPLEWNETMFSYIDKAPSLYSVALINALYHLSIEIGVIDFDYLIPDSFKLDPFFVANAPVEFQNRHTKRYDARVSRDRKWIAVRHRYRKVSLFEKRNHLENFDYGKPVYVIKDVEHFAFVEDSSVFLYYSLDKLLHALRLHTGTKLFSASGLSPFFHPLKQQVGYLFGFDQGKELIEFLILFQSSKPSLETTFISAGTILSAVFRGIWKGVDDVVSFAQVKNFVFSQDSNLVAIHQGTSIGVIDCGKFLYTLCGDHREYDESYLAFSTDSTLLLYCIQNSIDNPRFYVWDVQNRVFSASFDSPSRLLSIDCCCLSSDNVKLVICGGFSIEIWEYGAPACRLITRVETNVFYSEVDKITYCTVSPEHNLLACCITDRIVLYTLNTPTDQFIGPLPRAHLGKIEFCQFLKGNRYLISYGVDGTVFLWDLQEWRPTAFAKITQGRENIVSLCVTHVEDEVVCLTSDGRYCVLNLCGLEHTIPSTLPAAKVKRTGKMIQEARGQIGEQHGLTVQSAQYSHRKDTSEDLDVDTLIEEMNLTCMEDSEDSDYGDDRDVRD